MGIDDHATSNLMDLFYAR